MDKLDNLKGLSYNPFGCHWHCFLDILEMGCELAILYVPISDLQIVGQAIQRKLRNCVCIKMTMVISKHFGRSIFRKSFA